VAGPGDWPLIYFESIARPKFLEIPVKILPITYFSFPCSVSFLKKRKIKYDTKDIKT
jgi:hypothetical protein